VPRKSGTAAAVPRSSRTAETGRDHARLTAQIVDSDHQLRMLGASFSSRTAGACLARAALLARASQEWEGFIRRVHDSVDRRRVLVEVTPDGRDRAGRFYSPLVADGVELVAGFSDA